MATKLDSLIRVRKHDVEQKQKALAELYRKAEEMKARAKEVPAFARTIVEDVIKTPKDVVEKRLAMGQINESNLIEDASGFFEKEFECEINVANESDPWIEDPANRAKRAKPYRPAIYVE